MSICTLKNLVESLSRTALFSKSNKKFLEFTHYLFGNLINFFPLHSHESDFLQTIAALNWPAHKPPSQVRPNCWLRLKERCHQQIYLLSMFKERSLTKNKNKTGPWTNAWDTPIVTSHKEDWDFLLHPILSV